MNNCQAVISGYFDHLEMRMPLYMPSRQGLLSSLSKTTNQMSSLHYVHQQVAGNSPGKSEQDTAKIQLIV